MRQKSFGAVLCIVAVLSLGCAGNPAAGGSDGLDAAIRETSDYLNGRLPQGNKLVFLNFQSDSPALSEYIIDGLIECTVNDRIFTVVDRANLELIQQEMNFQLSGEVSDESAQAIGQKLGAQTIVSGTIAPLGSVYRLRVRAIGVETAEIEGQINRDIANSRRLADLTGGRVAVPATAASAKVYKIGERGPAGGIVFFDKGVFEASWRYLEAAPNDIGPAPWGTFGIDIRGTKEDIGSGKQNTQLILAVLRRLGETGKAAQLCEALTVNGYNDWFLPSMDELELMYTNLKQKGLGNLQDTWYSSSTQEDSLSAYIRTFSDGHQYHSIKGVTDFVRAVRAF
jgi:TolB-like protein